MLLDFLKHRRWEGNIRELENFVERLVTLAPAEMKILTEEVLPAEIIKEFNRNRRGLQKAPLRNPSPNKWLIMKHV